jgi:hypothetical protein
MFPVTNRDCTQVRLHLDASFWFIKILSKEGPGPRALTAGTDDINGLINLDLYSFCSERTIIIWR